MAYAQTSPDWVGGTLYRYVTNVLDPRQLSLRQLAELYARCWDIELGFRLVKRYSIYRKAF